MKHEKTHLFTEENSKKMDNNRSQSLGGHTVSSAGAGGGGSGGAPQVTPVTHKKRACTSHSHAYFELRELQVSDGLFESRLVCLECHPEAADKKLSSAQLGQAMTARIAANPENFVTLTIFKNNL